MAFPTWQGDTALIVGTSPSLSGITYQADDILGIFSMVKGGDVIPTLSTPNGWAEVTGSGVNHNETGGGFDTACVIFWKRAASGSETLPVISGMNHSVGFAVRGCITSGDPYEAVATNDDGTNDTTHNFPGTTTTSDDVLVQLLGFAHWPNNWGSWTVSLSNVVEQWDYQRDGGTVSTRMSTASVTGEKASGGSIAASTATLDVGAKGLATIIGWVPPQDLQSQVILHDIMWWNG